MKTVILCGGLGTRLREETEFRPKPMVEIGGKPILWHIMKIYGHYGFSEFVLCLGYKANVIKEYFLNYEMMSRDLTINLGSKRQIQFHSSVDEEDLAVTLVDTGLETMTGGRVKRVEPYIDDETFMVTYGDGVGDIDIRRLMEFHRRHGKIATLTTVRPISRFGVLDVEEGGQVARYREKPQLDGWISAGFFVFNRAIFAYLDRDCVLEGEPLERLSREGELVAYRHDGFWFGMDTQRDVLYLNGLWNNSEAAWRVWR